ncbi:unnamed protein product [Clonostachys solani]|uniref:Mitotic apparatus protein p62 n=1 Tax=Clonostachys solani TaxID=160281 RepID=A0A9N9YXY4_9HYPO|nr:unnamed protein product [Clonostachys solani]
MAPASRVLKFDRTDDESRYVLLNVTSRGSKPLDLRIEATEGDEEYAQNLRHDKVVSHMVKNCPVTESEWQAILERLFTQEPQPDIQVTATVETGTSITVTIRKSVQGITQRLGAITIGVAPGSEFNVLDWCATAVDAAAESKALTASTATKIQDFESTIADLKHQLDELIKAKDEDETALLFKFRDLLNEKKVKIREQQKVIESAPITRVDDPPEEAEPVEAEPPKKGRKAATSRASKRKAPPTKVEEESDQEEFEPMDVDRVKSEPEETEREDDSEATASTTSDAEGDDVPIKETTSKGKSSAPATKPPTTASQPPAPRTLPFGKQRATAPAKAPAPTESETDSDDEL